MNRKPISEPTHTTHSEYAGSICFMQTIFDDISPSKSLSLAVD